jgi:hypothetical protein
MELPALARLDIRVDYLRQGMHLALQGVALWHSFVMTVA